VGGGVGSEFCEQNPKSAWGVIQINSFVGGLMWIVTWERPITDFPPWSRQSLPETIVTRQKFLHVYWELLMSYQKH
jgi:hypothetical protein